MVRRGVSPNPNGGNCCMCHVEQSHGGYKYARMECEPLLTPVRHHDNRPSPSRCRPEILMGLILRNPSCMDHAVPDSGAAAGSGVADEEDPYAMERRRKAHVAVAFNF